MNGHDVPELSGVSDTGAVHPQAGARGVQIGHENVQVNYFVSRDRLTLTDGVNRPPLVDISGTVESPYRGLGAFGERDAPFFHGRQAATQEILDRLSDAARGSGLLVVSGVSGAGKSSLLRAGVLPRIRGEGLASVPGAARWTGLIFTPTRDPLEQLALQTANLLGTDAVRVRGGIADDPESFALTTRQLALRSVEPDADAEGRVLLIADQFEQVFTQCTDGGLRRTFVGALGAAARTGAALVVIAVRADFDARCADFPQLTAAVKERYLVTAMDELQLRTAIEQPVATLASATGQPLSVETSLVDYLVWEMLETSGNATLPTSGAGALPLLSHALDQAWRNRAGPVLTLVDYERGGRIQGAVEASAQRAFESLTPAQRTVARQMFLRLTATSEDGTPVRDRVSRDELLGVAGHRRHDDVAEVLAAFTAERLITQAPVDVEISHDALLTAWPLLRDEWLGESRADLAVRGRLRNAAREWVGHGAKPGYLYRDEILDEASGAVDRMIAAPGRQPELSQQEEEFLRASLRAKQSSIRVRRIVRGVLAALTVGLAVAVIVALTSLASANRDLNVADVQQMSAVSEAQRNTNPAVSALAAADAWHAAPSQETHDLAIEAATNPLLGEFDAAAGQVAASPDGSVLAVSDITSGLPVAGAPSGTNVTLWSTRERAVLGHITLSANTPVFSVAFSPIMTGRAYTLAISTSNGVVLYRVSGSSFRPLQTLQTGEGTGWQSSNGDYPVAFGRNGMLAVGATAQADDVWLYADAGGHYPARPMYVIANEQSIESLSFGPDGSLAVGTENGVSVYPAAGGYSSPPVTMNLGSGNVLTAAQFNAAGLLVITDSARTVVDRYSSGTLTSVALDPSAQNSGTQVAALSDQNVLAVAESDGLHLYVAGKRTAVGFIEVLTIPYPGQQGPGDLEFTPDGNALAENIGGKVYVYDTRALVGMQDDIAPDGEGGPQVLGFDPVDTAILAAAIPSAVDLINVIDGKVAALPDTANSAWAAFAPSGALAVVTGGTVRIFPDPLTAPDRSSVMSGITDAFNVTFSSAGVMAVLRDGQPALTIYPPGNFSAGTVVQLSVPGTPRARIGADNAVFGPDGQLAAVVGTGKSLAGIEVLTPVTYADEGFIADTSLALAADDELIAFAPDGTLAVGNAADIELYAAGIYRNPQIIAGVHSVDDSGYSWLTFSRGGILLSADSSVGVSLWDGSGQNLATFSVGVDQYAFGGQLAVSPDGRYFAFEDAVDYGLGASDNADVIMIWPAPYLDGDVADGVRSLCDGLDGAPDQSQWHQDSLGLPYPGICS